MIVKFLMKLISLYIICDILEVKIIKNPTPLGVGVSGRYLVNNTCYYLKLKGAVKVEDKE